ncbi:MAG: ABC transporter permease [Oscillospiraceae bacterium]|nr:ABC transporter permease [Oscillospiraceae bacterium]
MFLFSFVGGIISPYGEDQLFYKTDMLNREFANFSENTEFRYAARDSKLFSSPVQAQVRLAISNGASGFTYKVSGADVTYAMQQDSEDLYSVYSGGELVGIAYKDIVTASDGVTKLSFDFIYAALKAYVAEEETFTVDGVTYTLDETGGISSDAGEIAYVSRYVVQAILPDVVFSRDFKVKLIAAIQNGETTFTYTDASLVADEESTEPDGDEGETGGIATDDEMPEQPQAPVSATAEYTIERSQNHAGWIIRQKQSSHLYDKYSFPSAAHWLGTDGHGMDMLTRLMYGGRVSLMIGFIVVIMETVLGVIFGGIAGYFGGWVDNLIMRLVDIFYCIPSYPVLIILGAAMDNQRLDPKLRMIYLMLILGFLGWAGIARLVRGQILSLREQEFMTATEACGISVSHRIFKHLVPNVIPQLIVNCTMSLGSVIITEASLSFLGLGVKFPFASWGNIINDVNNIHVLTTYWFIWIPAGVLLLLTVLAFNLVGDGLRDAFDPKMKR